MALTLLLAAGCSGGESGTGGESISTSSTAQLTVHLADAGNGGTGSVTASATDLTCVGMICSGTFPAGTAVTLTATPQSSHAFGGWSGDCTGQGPCHLTMEADKTATASFNGPTPVPVVSLSISGSGSGSVASDVGSLACTSGTCNSVGLVSGQTVQLNATSATGSFFQGWTGGLGTCVGTTNPCSFMVTADTAMTAAFFRPAVTVQVSGLGTVTSAPGGILCPTGTCVAQFDYGSDLVLTAAAGPGALFGGWQFAGPPPGGTCTGLTNPCTIQALGADVTVSASFTTAAAMPVVSVTFLSTYGGTGTVSSAGAISDITDCGTGPCAATYVSGATASLTAVPSGGSAFAGWTAGPCGGTATNPCVVTGITANQTMTAHFTRPQLALTLTGTGTVRVTGSLSGAQPDCTASCARPLQTGEAVTLSAAGREGMEFHGWSGAFGTCVGTTTPCSFVMPGQTASITAEFGMPSGAVDTGFGTNGIVKTAVGTGKDEIRAVAIQGDGKIVVAGSAFAGGNANFAVARYNQVGTVDQDFGTGGSVITPLGSGESSARAVIVQPDGKILVAGSAYNGANYDVALARYNQDGSLDTTFSQDGKVTTPVGTGDDYAYGVALQSDGKILVSGNTASGNNIDFALVRYNADGTLDTSFDSDGKAVTPIGTGDNEGTRVAIQPDGKILVAGHSPNGTMPGLAVVRYLPTGSLDPSFDGDGKVTTDFTGREEGWGLAVHEGNIILAGVAGNGSSNHFVVARYTFSGSVDPTFDGDGTTTLDLENGEHQLGGVAIQPDGKILLVGSVGSGGNAKFALARLNWDGTPDAGFGSNGQMFTTVGSRSSAYAVAIQADGKILAAGATTTGGNTDFAIVRYWP